LFLFLGYCEQCYNENDSSRYLFNTVILNIINKHWLSELSISFYHKTLKCRL
jgi:hypothetical protein